MTPQFFFFFFLVSDGIVIWNSRDFNEGKILPTQFYLPLKKVRNLDNSFLGRTNETFCYLVVFPFRKILINRIVRSVKPPGLYIFPIKSI